MSTATDPNSPPHLEEEGSELGDEELRLLEASYRFVADASSFDGFIEKWNERLKSVDIDGVTKVDDFLLNRHLTSLAGMMKTVVSEETDPKDEIEDTVASATAAAAVISRGNLVVELNDTAKDEWGLLRGAATELDWIESSSHANLEAVRRSALSQGNKLHSVLRIFDRNGEASLAEVFAIDPKEHPGLIAVRALDFGWDERLISVLQSAFGVTDAEIEICRLLLELRDTNDIAEYRNASAHTIRTQLRSIFAKTETTSQVDLVRMLGLLSTHIVSLENRTSAKWQDPLGRQRVFKDEFGKDIAYTWMGDPDGRPAIMSHGLATGYMLHERARQRLREGGIKLYCISRPGFGDSEPSVHTDPIEGAANALLSLSRHLELDRWIAVGLAVGTPPIFRVANRTDSGVVAVVCASSFIPFAAAQTDEDGFEHFSPMRRVANKFMRSSPTLAELAVMIAYRMMKVRGPEFAWQSMYSACEADRAAAKDPDCVALIRTAVSHLTAQKHKGLHSDMRIIVSEWDHDFLHCEVPVTFLHGTDDPAVPIAKLLSLTDKKPNMRVLPLKDAGELLFFCHPEALAEAVIEAADREIA